MPIYQYECSHCGKGVEIYKFMDQLDRPEPCPGCFRLMERALMPHRGNPFTPYYSDQLSPYDDRPILVESVQHRRQLEKEMNVIPWWPGIGKKGCWV